MLKHQRCDLRCVGDATQRTYCAHTRRVAVHDQRIERDLACCVRVRTAADALRCGVSLGRCSASHDRVQCTAARGQHRSAGVGAPRPRPGVCNQPALLRRSTRAQPSEQQRRSRPAAHASNATAPCSYERNTDGSVSGCVWLRPVPDSRHSAPLHSASARAADAATIDDADARRALGGTGSARRFAMLRSTHRATRPGYAGAARPVRCARCCSHRHARGDQGCVPA